MYFLVTYLILEEVLQFSDIVDVLRIFEDEFFREKCLQRSTVNLFSNIIIIIIIIIALISPFLQKTQSDTECQLIVCKVK